MKVYSINRASFVLKSGTHARGPLGARDAAAGAFSRLGPEKGCGKEVLFSRNEIYRNQWDGN